MTSAKHNYPQRNESPQMAYIRQLAVNAAVAHPLAFGAYCFRDKKGNKIRPAAVHAAIQEFIRRNPRCVIMIPPSHGKSEQVARIKVLHDLSHNVNGTYAIISQRQWMSGKSVKAIREMIEKSPEYHDCFPNVVRGTGVWSNQAITVERQPGIPDPSIVATSRKGALNGARLDGVVVDDVDDVESVRTQAARNNTDEWFSTTVESRLSPTGWCVVICTAWDEDDLAHRLERRGWPTLRLPAIIDEGLPTERALWPEAWSLEDLKKIRDANSLRFSRVYQQTAISDTDSMFQKAWVTSALRRGTKAYKTTLLPTDHDGTVICGVDPNVVKKATSDDSAFAIVLVGRDGHRTLLEMDAFKGDGPSILRHMGALDKRYKPIFYVESVAAQAYLKQFSDALGLRLDIRSHYTGKTNPLDFEVNKLAAEFEQQKWTLPSMPGGESPVHQEISNLIKGMYKYRYGQHVDDRLAALCFVRAHADDGRNVVREIPNFLSR